MILNRRSSDDLSKMLNPAECHFASPGENDDLRDYGVGAQILSELGVNDMILLTNSHHSLIAFDGYGLNVVGERRIDK